MRLIDADKLKMTTITRWNGDVDFVVYKEELDNAPTVIAEKQTDPTDGDLISRQAVLDIFGDIHPLDYNARAYVAQIKELPSAENTAEWIFIKGIKTCNNCHAGLASSYDNYCPNCGRRMLGEQTE